MDFLNDENMKNDKIINNSFNAGEINYQEFSQTIKVDNRVSSLYEDQIGDLIEYRTFKKLSNDIFEIFENSDFYKKYKNPKRVDKTDMIKMYYFFKNELNKSKEYSPMEIFIGFAEFFQINYDQLYSEIKVLDKELLLKELNNKYDLKNKIKTKKLF